MDVARSVTARAQSGSRLVSWRNAHRLRRIVQAAVFAFFIVVLILAGQRVGPPGWADVFFRFDPLAGASAMLSEHAWLSRFGLLFATVALTVVLGRVWCGWICPLGTLLEWFTFRRARRRALSLPPRLRQVKYVLLVVILVMAAVGSLTLLVLDPLALLTRTMAVSVLPAVNYGVTRLEQLLYHVDALQPRIDWFEAHARGAVVPGTQQVFAGGLLVALVLLAIVALNALADRFWCRTLCPLGALLGLVAKVSLLRPTTGKRCTSCALCAHACRLDAIDLHEVTTAAADEAQTSPPAAVVTSECVMCLDCLVACPVSMAVGATLRPAPWQTYDPGRREFLAAAATGVGAVLLLGTGVWSKVPAPGLLRPPGVVDEDAFLAACVRCGECLQVCPTSGLQPALAEAGWTGFWSPVLKPRLGYCTYDCVACGTVCPSGAIPRLTLEQKHKAIIGRAVIDRDRCLPWSQKTACIVCQEVCPLPKKAVVLKQRPLRTNAAGFTDYLQLPVVVADRCTGCGICENLCPVPGRAAITVEHWSAVDAPATG
jgi:MauM/NapG family ferredoxin protein